MYGKEPATHEVRKIYLPLLDLVGWGKNRISLYTANYDPVTDIIMDVADEEGIPAYDGFKNRGVWDKSLYRNERKGLDIYRIHGSMSWVQKGTRVINTRDYALRSGSHNKHLIIYPGYKGDPENGAEEVFSHPHRSLREELNNINIFIVIGFSFRDKHLNKMFSTALETNKELRIIIITPELPRGLDGALTKLKESYDNRIHHIPGHFGDPSILEQLRLYI